MASYRDGMSTTDCTDFATLAIHAGFDPDPVTGDVVPPMHVASTYVQDRPGQLRSGYDQRVRGGAGCAGGGDARLRVPVGHER